MRIKVYVIELSPRGKRNLILGGAFAILAATALPADATITQFNAGDALSAATMNANFADLNGRMTTLETFTTTGTKIVETRSGKKYSLGAVYCGKTGNTTGNLGGWAGTKASCETACSSASAHMCTADEIARSGAIGSVPPGTSWYAAGIAGNSDGNHPSTECLGWSSSGSTDNGPQWVSAGNGYGWVGYCNQSQPALCCD